MDEFARKNGITRQRLRMLFQKACGMSPMRFLVCQRMRIARQLLSQTMLSVKDIAEKTGYSSSARFCHAFQKENGTSPLEFRAGNRKSNYDFPPGKSI